ncbi:MAG: CHAP domain-containing protein [Burkholderiaceae bacterium]|nr:CHAP domain-containing protein [Burkholderiaceae bacterium]
MTYACTIRRVANALVGVLLVCATITAYGTPVRVVVPSDSALWQRSLRIAIDQNGVREATGKNDGKMVESYLRSVGLGKGNPYCQAGQYWAFARAAAELSMPTTEIPLLRTGSTQAAWNHAVRTGRKTAVAPKAGDIITWWTAGTYKGHVERVVSVSRGGWVRTIGFNTSSGKAGSQRDGGGVYLRYRNWVSPDMRMLVRGFTGYTKKGNAQ